MLSSEICFLPKFMHVYFKNQKSEMKKKKDWIILLEGYSSLQLNYSVVQVVSVNCIASKQLNDTTLAFYYTSFTCWKYTHVPDSVIHLYVVSVTKCLRNYPCKYLCRCLNGTNDAGRYNPAQEKHCPVTFEVVSN